MRVKHSYFRNAKSPKHLNGSKIDQLMAIDLQNDFRTTIQFQYQLKVHGQITWVVQFINPTNLNIWSQNRKTKPSDKQCGHNSGHWRLNYKVYKVHKFHIFIVHVKHWKFVLFTSYIYNLKLINIKNTKKQAQKVS